MDLNLRGKVAVVVGASSGIGAQVAISLGQEGCKVYALARRTSPLESLCEQIQCFGGVAVPISCDIGRDQSIAEAYEAIAANGECIDVLVNCAAITAQQINVTDQIARFRAIIDLNLSGIYSVCRQAVPLLARNAAIVNFSSLAAYVPGIGQDNYTAAKAGVSGLTRALAKELAPRGVRVNAICPGFVDTPMTALAHGDAREQAISCNLFHRAGTPQELADAVLFLASERASFITGQTIHVNGGQYMA